VGGDAKVGRKGVEKAGEVGWGCGLLGFWGKRTGVGRWGRWYELLDNAAEGG